MLDAAAKHVRMHGPHTVAIADVMADAGLTVGAFYGHFDSREAIVHAAIGHMFGTSPVDLLKGDDLASPEVIIRRFLDYYLSPDHRDTRIGGCPLPFLMADAPRLPEDLRDQLVQGSVSGMIKLVAGHITALGTAPADIAPRALAASVVAETVGAVILARADTDPERSQRILDDCKHAVLRRLGLQPLGLHPQA